MPPKRKRDTEDAATEEPKKLTKAEKAKKKQEQILKAKKWAEERQKAKLAKQNGASTSTTAAKETPVKKTPTKKKRTTARTPKSTRSARKKPVIEEVQEEEEEAPKPRTKRRKLSSTEEESTPAVQEKTESQAKINIQQSVTSPAAIHVKQSDGSDLVYVPVETVAQNVSSSTVAAPVPAPVSLSVPSPEKPIVKETEEKPPVKKTVMESTQASIETNVATTVEVVEEEAEESTESKKPSVALAFLKNFVMCTGIASAVGFVLLSLSLYIFDSENSSSNGTLSSTTSPDVTSHSLCFDNHGFGEESGVSCENPVPCPEFGMCQGGSLVKCLDYDFEWDGDFYIPSEKKNGCVIAPNAMESLLGLHKTLTDLTVEHVCRSNFGVGTVCRVSKENIFVNGTILFKLDAVAQVAELTQSQVLLLLEKMDTSDIVQKVITQDGVDVEFIGMSEEFVAKKLPVQTSCWIRMLIWDILVYTATFVYGTLKVLATLAWSIASANPLPTAVVAIITYALLWVQNKRSRVASLRKQAAEIQNIAYDKLIMDCNEGEGYASLHLRDEIAHEKYPEPGAQRHYFINNVWPRSLALIRADNRVTKSRKSVGGKSLEWLEWVSDSSRKSRRSLAAANSSNEGENKTKIE